MIEFLLLFALGFLAAALVALVVAPIIQRRIVTLTERRMRASVPLSTAEVRAEKDMARAAFAAENARLSVDLKQNREKLTESIARSARLSDELVAIRAQKLEAEKAIEEREEMIRELTSEVTDRDAKINTLTGNFSDAARLAEARKQELAIRNDQINRLGAEIEELRIDLVTLDTEAESFKAQIRELRDERSALRERLKEAEEINRDLQIRQRNDAERLAQYEEKLARTVSALTDREYALERRVAEVERFRQKNRELADETRAAKKALRDAVSGTRKAAADIPQHLMELDEEAHAEPVAEEPPVAKQPAPEAPRQAPEIVPEKARPEPAISAAPEAPASAEPAQTAAETAAAKQPAPEKPRAPAPVAAAPARKAPPPAPDDLSEDEKIDRLRARQAALIERLLKADKPGNDAALRREIATVAAMMVELTASRDGAASPIHSILKGSEDPLQPGSSEPSLATRAREMLAASS